MYNYKLENYPDLTGMIVKRSLKGYGKTPVNEHWKIIGKPYNSFCQVFYPVIKCTKTGKEYLYRNSFPADICILLHDGDNSLAPRWEKVGEVETRIKEAERKNRIAHLKGKIAQYTEELERLERK